MHIALSALEALGSLVIILASCELFTNGIEWFGHRLNLSRGAVGSVLAAVGTALPETLVPVVAILIVGGHQAKEIGIGAILGAPFMLSTLAFAVTGLAAVAYRRRRPHGAAMVVSVNTLRHDFGYFIVVYLVAVLASPLLQMLSAERIGIVWAEGLARAALALGLVAAYVVYVLKHLRAVGDREHSEGISALYFQFRASGRPRLRFICAQVLVALVGIIVGAHIFVEGLKQVSEALSVPPLVLSLIITPIATELPEKFNSVLWVRRSKDTLAIGNISGAMVFQSCIPVAIGISLTKWVLDQTAVASAVVALVSVTIVYGYLLSRKRLSAGVLLAGVPLYLAFLLVAFFSAR